MGLFFNIILSVVFLVGLGEGAQLTRKFLRQPRGFGQGEVHNLDGFQVPIHSSDCDVAANKLHYLVEQGLSSKCLFYNNSTWKIGFATILAILFWVLLNQL